MGVYTMPASVHFNDVNTENQLTMKGALRLMQEASNCHSDQVGYGMNQILETGYSWVLHQQRCRIYKRPCWSAPLTIRTWSRGAEGLICLRDFEMLDAQGERVAIATTAWLLVDAKTQRMIKVPEGMMEEYGTVEEAVFEEPMKRLKMLTDAPKTWEYTILKRDIDINRHVNNLCYLDYALEALPAGIEETDFNEVSIMYKKASYLGEQIACFGAWDVPGPEASPGLVTLSEPGTLPGGSGKEKVLIPTQEMPGRQIAPYVVAIKDPEGQHLHAIVRLERN